MGYFAPREAATTLPCPDCGRDLMIKRSCQEVHRHCPACRKDFPLRDFIAAADAQMENFLENVYCDRI